MAGTTFPAASSASYPTTFLMDVPSGLTLRYTYTSSQSGLNYSVNQVFVVLVGGGGAGAAARIYTTSACGGGAGGGGAVVMGWIPSPAVITIGASNGYSKIGSLYANPGGAGDANGYSSSSYGGAGIDGAGAGGADVVGFSLRFNNLFKGGGTTYVYRNSAHTNVFINNVHSGYGGTDSAGVGQTGLLIGGGSGGGSSSANGANGAAGLFAGGTGATSGVARGGGGGGGYLGAGSNGVAGAGTGGAGGSGGGGGGGGGGQDSGTVGAGGAGGAGCCLVYW